MRAPRVMRAATCVALLSAERVRAVAGVLSGALAVVPGVAPAVVLVAAAPAAGQAPRDTLDVLFVGNSYVYFNDLPAMVEGISTALDGPVLRAAAHTHGGWTLRGHLDDGHLPSLLERGPDGRGEWDRVVLQEQSTLGAPYDPEVGTLGAPDAFRAAAREVVALVRSEGAGPVFYMTWAKEPYPAQTEALSSAYRSVAGELGAAVAPVGEAWAAARRERPDLGLFITDGSHPNPAGSYLAACVLYATLTGRSPVGAPRELTGAPWDYAGLVASSAATVLASLSAEDATFLQNVAWSSVRARGAGR